MGVISKLETRLERLGGLTKQCKELEIEKEHLKKSLRKGQDNETKAQLMYEQTREKSERSLEKISELESSMHEEVKKCEVLGKKTIVLETDLKQIRDKYERLQIKSEDSKKQLDIVAVKLRSKSEALSDATNRCTELETMNKKLE